MNIDYRRWYSPALGQDMELKVYGSGGWPFIVFPTSSGRFFDFENNGMVASAERFIKEGKITLFAVDSIDQQSWDNPEKQPEEKARRHNDYDRYIVTEVIPFIHERTRSRDRIMCTGVSMGAAHAVLFFCRHPDLFQGVIALSGVYNFRYFLNNYQGNDLDVYYNSPLDFLPNQSDERVLEQMRDSNIIICVGQGAWEEPMIADTRRMQEILRAKKIPGWIDFWGHDVNHDWPWWRKQFPYFLGKLYE